MKIAVKYCGGCNPEYDRVALVAQIEECLREKVDFVSPEAERIDLVMAVQGCRTACADLSLFEGLQIQTITNMAEGENFVRRMLKKNVSN